jgi:hypothetical protein
MSFGKKIGAIDDDEEEEPEWDDIEIGQVK